MRALTMRPKFKTAMYYIPVPEGVYLRGNNSHLLLKGKSLYRLLEHLFPHLNGDATLEELTNGLDAERKHMIVSLIEKLYTHQFLTDVSKDQAYALSWQERETEAPDLTFLEAFQTEAHSRFEAFRQKHLLLLGSGRSLTSLVQAALHCGVRQISAIALSEEEPSRQNIRDLLVDCISSEQTVRLMPAPDWDNQAEARRIIQSCDAVLHIADRPMVARAQRFNQLCVAEQKTFIQAVILETHAWIGPLVSAETEGCWECAWRRLQANLSRFSAPLSHYAFQDQPQTSDSHLQALPEMTIVANHLLFAIFKHVTQIGSPETRRELSFLHLETGLSESHAFLPHPHCQACQHPVSPTEEGFLEQIQQLQSQPPLDRDTLLMRLTSAVVDPRLGLFTVPEGDTFVQAPLAISTVTLSDPLCQKTRPDVLTVATISRETEDVTAHAAQQACACYAANLVDYRRLFQREAGYQSMFPADSAEQWRETPSSPDQPKMWTWAVDLQTNYICPVPAENVFPALCRPDQRGKSARGIASGMSWDEAICQALLDWCNYLTIEEVQGAHQAYARVDLTRVPLSSEGRYVHHLLRTVVGQQLVVYDVTGSLRVPTFAMCLDAKVVAYSTHCDVAEALGSGLKQALQQYQAEQCQQLEYAVAPVPDVPSVLRASYLTVPCSPLADGWSAQREWLLQRLQAGGFRAWVVPLDHDPALARILPFIVRVVLRNVESQRGE